MAKYYVGTAGWSYEDWEGIVYPVSKGRGFHPLAFLADFINIVEVNSTFYRPAPPAMVHSWLKRIESRPDFLLSLKLYQAFTHAREGFTPKDVDEVGGEADLVDVLRRETLPGVGEGLVELEGQQEIRAALDSLQPRVDHGRRRGPVEGAVDLDDVDEVGEKREGMETAALRDRIDDAFPVLVAPAGGADVILGHESLLYLRP